MIESKKLSERSGCSIAVLMLRSLSEAAAWLLADGPLAAISWKGKAMLKAG